ncbi:MAG TPA: I78 family peptidase inhibitor [Pseudoxanthomonas sp.]|nr:I78 family peptidase inhibitor [Pseudoxanthomonas sp.]
MSPRHLRLCLAAMLASAAAACSVDGAQGTDEAEQEQAEVAARQAADAAAQPAQAAPPAPSCDASQVQGRIGQAADEAGLEQARQDAGAERLRVLRPGQVVTLEFDGARLNVEVDANDRIVALRCG